MANCTMPRAFGFHAWYEAKFGDLCRKHDEQYAAGVPRHIADQHFVAGIILRGYPALAFLTYLFVRVVGRFHYTRAF